MALSASAILLAGMVGSAAAADLPESPSPVAVAAGTNWTGLYAGLKGSYNWAHSTATIVSPPIGAGATTDPRGAMIGGEIGYNFQPAASPFVFGVGADFMTGGVSGNGNYRLFNFFNVPVTMEMEDLGSVTARIGYAAGRWLPYVVGGYAFGDAKRTDTLFTSSSDTKWFNGWTAGVGAEYAINRHWSVKGEYRYTDLGTETFNLPSLATVDAKLKNQSVDFGVNYRF